MKTQCQNCKHLLDVPDIYINRTIKCIECKQSFKVAPYCDDPAVEIDPNTPAHVEELPDSNQPKEIIKTPGDIWYSITMIVAMFGVMGIIATFIMGNVAEGLIIIVSTVISCLSASAVGGVLNRLERIAHHTEHLRKELDNNPIDHV